MATIGPQGRPPRHRLALGDEFGIRPPSTGFSMRAALPVIIAGGVVVVAATGAVLAPLAWADSGSRSGPRAPELAAEATPPAPPILTDADRRADLEQRLQTMIKEGRGSRLTDAKPQPRPQPRPARRADGQSPAPRREARGEPSPDRLGSGRPEPSSTIAPPAVRSNGFNFGSLLRPRLDLKTPAVVPNNPIECLTQAIYYEARSESEEGQAAVAAVVMNRSRSGRYPRDVCQVVYQRNSRTCQFTFTCDGSIGRRPVNMTSWARAERIAREVHEGRSSVSLPGDSVNYHAHYVRPTWGQRLEQVRQIGAHIFYGAPKPGHRNPGAEEPPVEAPKQGGLVFVTLGGQTLGGEPIPTR